MVGLTWLDYSERERQQVMEVINLLGDESARDELGIGSIRDALADRLFPGTSTIQTRLRYFLFVPWALSELETRRIPSHEAATRSRRLQGRLRDALIASGKADGVIGFVAGHKVQRLPSNIYWGGLGKWGIRLYPGSEAAYYQSLDAFYNRQRTNRGSADGEPGKDAELCNWDPSLPPPPDGFMEQIDFSLSGDEADYLIDRIRYRAPDSLLRVLIDRGATAPAHISFPWEHPATANLPEKPATALTHAHNFSQLIHGAALIYNLILAEQSQWDQGVQKYRLQLNEWWNGTIERGSDFAQWHQEVFWKFMTRSNARITPCTRAFVDDWRNWFDRAHRIEDLMDNRGVRQLITSRESKLKGKRARIGNQRALESWSGASGTAQLDYRWNKPVATYLNDLADAFSEGGANA
ncbi:MAG: DUF6361 family protein [Opitutales bacterium]